MPATVCGSAWRREREIFRLAALKKRSGIEKPSPLLAPFWRNFMVLTAILHRRLFRKPRYRKRLSLPTPSHLPSPHLTCSLTKKKLQTDCMQVANCFGVHFGDKAETSWSPDNCRGRAKLGLDSGAKIQTYTQSYQYPLQFAKWPLFHVCLSLLKLEVKGGIVAQGGKKWKT